MSSESPNNDTPDFSDSPRLLAAYHEVLGSEAESYGRFLTASIEYRCAAEAYVAAQNWENAKHCFYRYVEMQRANADINDCD